MAGNPLEWTPKPGKWHPPKWLTWGVYLASIALGAWLAGVVDAGVPREGSRLVGPFVGGVVGFLAGALVLRLCEVVSDLRHGRPVF